MRAKPRKTLRHKKSAARAPLADGPPRFNQHWSLVVAMSHTRPAFPRATFPIWKS